MKQKQYLFLIISAFTLSISCYCSSPVLSTGDIGFRTGVGAGMGLSYGDFGFKGVMRYNQAEASVGLGIMPLSWKPVISFSGTYLFDIGHSHIIPKISLVYSKKSAAVLLYDSGDFDILYDKYYPGIAPYAGMYIAINEDQKFLIDLCIGYIITFEGNSNVVDHFEDQKKAFENLGYTFTSPLINSMYLPKVSLGMHYYF